MRKSLVVILMVAALLVSAGALAAGRPLPGKSRALKSTAVTLSFKPFTVGELIHLKLRIDFATIGKPIHSAMLVTIENQTSRLRGLPLKKQVKFVEVAEEGIRLQTLVEFNQDTPPADIEADQKLLVALGLFPPNESLEAVLTNVYTEQIAGSYDPKTKEITIVSGKGMGSAMDDVTMSHEITHALQDQNFNLQKPPLDNKAYNGDNDSAVTSLIEGDAQNTSFQYAKTYLSVAQLQDLATADVPASPVLDSAPLYIRRSVLFPYEQGLKFVQQLAAKGDGPVDKALKDPPLSTEQIIHPDKYIVARDNPRPVPLADISASLGKGYKKINEDCLGEFDIDVMFEQFFGTRGLPSVGAGWGGNTIQYYQGPNDNYVLVSDTVWDTPNDATEFYDAYARLLDKRFGARLNKLGTAQTAYTYEAEGVLFYCGRAGDATLFLQAPNRATLNKILANYPLFPPAP